MAITIPFEALLHLENLTYDLQTHYYALTMLADVCDSNWPDVRYTLLSERVDAMEETVRALCAFGDALQL